jgi:TDG/mug DNA glycosylase family protein
VTVAASRPTKAELEASRSRTLRDVLAPGLRVVFCGINPGLYSAAIGRHFGRPGNRFWPALHRGGFTDRLYSPHEDDTLLDLRLGLTNLVARTTAAAAELSDEELKLGGQRLRRKLRRYRPEWLAVLGLTAYRTAFDRPDAVIGPQAETIGDTRVWILPSPSGLNAHYQLDDLAAQFAALKAAVDA